MNQNNQQTDSTTFLSILKYGDPILRKKVRQVDDFTIIPEMVEQMFYTMAKEHGVGLAANQVGCSFNLMVVDTHNCEDEEKGEASIFINSEILTEEGAVIMEEGCLSIPDIRANIKRAEAITLKYQDINQNFHERYFSGLISRVIQHEMDHLNGKLFIDYLSQSKRMLIKKRLFEISKIGKPESGIIL